MPVRASEHAAVPLNPLNLVCFFHVFRDRAVSIQSVIRRDDNLLTSQYLQGIIPTLLTSLSLISLTFLSFPGP
jgi:hypothetical protein